MTRIGTTLALLLAAVALLTACGGGGDDPAAVPASTAPGTPANPVPADADADEQSSETAAKATPSYGKLVRRQRRGKKAHSRFTPCNLVTKSEAQAILDARLQEPNEAPLGPTCIYRTADGKSFVTVAVQSITMAKATSHLPRLQRLRVADHPAACAPAGRATLYVSVSRRQLLTVAGPCSTAQKFATTAIGRLAG